MIKYSIPNLTDYDNSIIEPNNMLEEYVIKNLNDALDRGILDNLTSILTSINNCAVIKKLTSIFNVI